MEDSGQNQLVSMAIGLILILLVGGVAFLIYRTSHGVVQNATNQVADLGVTLEESKFTQHDGEIMTGSQVLSVITGFQGEALTVEIDDPAITLTCSEKSQDFNLHLQEMRNSDSSNAKYLNPRKKYLCTCTYEDGIVTKITFKKQ